MRDTLPAFRELKGVGPATEAKLHAAGVYSWAAMSEVLNALVTMRGLDASTVKQLAEQAARLAQESGAQAPDSGNPGRSEAFVLRMSVPQDRRSTRSTVTHVRSQAQKAWLGWSPNDVIRFIESRSGLDGPVDSAAEQHSSEPVSNELAATEHRVSIDAGRTVGGASRDIELVLSTSDISEDDDFTWTALLAARPYGSDAADGSWTTVAEHRGRGHGRQRLPLRFVDVTMSPGVHRLRVDLALRFARPRHTLSALKLADAMAAR